MATLLTPIPIRLTDALGIPQPGGKLYTWAAGSSSAPLAVYTDASEAVPLSNPVVADSGGLLPQLWLGASAYKFEARKADGVTVLWQSDTIQIVTQQALGAAYVDQFTGDGATVNFTLSHNPGSQANLAVSVGGVVQRNGVDFSWSAGVTLTFTTAPPITAPIQVRYTNALPISFGSASSINLQRSIAAAISTNEQSWHDLQVLDAGADFGMSTAASAATNTTALQSAISSATVLGSARVEIPPGNYAVTAGTNFAAAGVSIIGRGRCTLDYSAGSGVGFLLDAGGSGASIGQMRVENLDFKGGPAITDAYQERGIVRSVFRNLNARECTNAGFNIRFAVLNQYDSIACSINVQAMTTKPTQGIKLDDDGAVGNYCSANTFTNTILEGLTGKTGLTLLNASQNLFLGGTSEANAVGIDIQNDQCQRNTFVNWDLEQNTTNDVNVKGISNGFISPLSNSAIGGNNFEVISGTGTFFIGGFLRTVNLQGGSTNTTFHGCGISRVGGTGIIGAGTYSAYGCTSFLANLTSPLKMPDVFDAVASWTPVITQNVNVTFTTTGNELRQSGRLVNLRANLTATSAGTAANAIVVSIPAAYAIKTSQIGQTIGTFIASIGGTQYAGVVTVQSATAIAFATSAGTGLLGVNPAATLANTNTLNFSVNYDLG